MKATSTFLLIFSIVAARGFAAWGQASVTYPIPPYAQMVPQVAQNMSQASYWLCGTGMSTVDGDQDTIYISRTGDIGISGALTVSGNSNVIYTRNGGDIQVHGNNNVIFACMCPSITVDGNNNQIHTLQTMPVTITGNNNARTNIAHIYFNLAHAPNGGVCQATITEIGPSSVKSQVSLAPNPVANGSMVTLSTVQITDNLIYLVDGMGRLTRSYPAGSKQLSLASVPAGIYRIRTVSDGKSFSIPLVVE